MTFRNLFSSKESKMYTVVGRVLSHTHNLLGISPAGEINITYLLRNV